MTWTNKILHSHKQTDKHNSCIIALFTHVPHVPGWRVKTRGNVCHGPTTSRLYSMTSSMSRVRKPKATAALEPNGESS